MLVGVRSLVRFDSQGDRGRPRSSFQRKEDPLGLRDPEWLDHQQ